MTKETTIADAQTILTAALQPLVGKSIRSGVRAMFTSGYNYSTFHEDIKERFAQELADTGLVYGTWTVRCDDLPTLHEAVFTITIEKEERKLTDVVKALGIKIAPWIETFGLPTDTIADLPAIAALSKAVGQELRAKERIAALEEELDGLRQELPLLTSAAENFGTALKAAREARS